jgi:hypothetical protein
LRTDPGAAGDRDDREPAGGRLEPGAIRPENREDLEAGELLDRLGERCDRDQRRLVREQHARAVRRDARRHPRHARRGEDVGHHLGRHAVGLGVRGERRGNEAGCREREQDRRERNEHEATRHGDLLEGSREEGERGV